MVFLDRKSATGDAFESSRHIDILPPFVPWRRKRGRKSSRNPALSSGDRPCHPWAVPWQETRDVPRHPGNGHQEPVEGILCKVSHANQKPILFLPDRSTQAGIPEGQIPKLFGTKSSPQWQQSGFIWEGTNMVLLVTLEKAEKPQQHHYEDRFLSPDTFQWQSQNRTTQKGKVGQAIRDHRKQGIEVHLFVRKTGKIDQRAAPFTLLRGAGFCELGG
jgi:hypothetical protein